MAVLDVIKRRRSIRKYSSREIAGDARGRLLESLRFAPSACNNQPWRFILVEDADRRKQVAQASRGQMWMADAPLIVVACGFPEQAYAHMGGYGNSIDIDLSIALDHLTLAAADEGLGTCWIGAFDEKAVQGILGIPEGVKIVAMMPVGYPADGNALSNGVDKKRKEPSVIFQSERWGD